MKFNKEQNRLRMIDDIIQSFDFEKCGRVMRVLNWRWAVINSVPNVEQMKSTAVYLLEGASKGCIQSQDCKPHETYFNATGGFKASAIKNKFGHLVFMKLEFVVSEWESDGDTD